jgi:hypothetical protein
MQTTNYVRRMLTMKRTLFSCCILLTALAVPLSAARNLHAQTSCATVAGDPDGIGHCALPQIYADTYGECFWEDDDCDRVADGQDACSIAEVAEDQTVTVWDDDDSCDDGNFCNDCDEMATDYWYDAQSGTYYEYQFENQEATAEAETDTACEALDDLFEICETQSATTTGTATDEPAAPESVADETAVCDVEDDCRCDYGYDYGYDDEYEYGYEDEYGCDDEYGYADEYEYEQEYEHEYEGEDEYAYDDDYGYDYGWESAADAGGTDTDAVVEPSDAEVGCPYVEDGLDYRDESYVAEVCKPADVDATVQAETAATAVTDEAVSESWQDDEYGYYGEDGYEYQGYQQYEYGYDPYEPAHGSESCPYEEEYLYEDAYDYWNEEAVEVEQPAQDAPVPAVVEEPAVAGDRQLPRHAVLSLARTLNRIGSSLQTLSQQLTEMVDEQVAAQPAHETLER